jgi:hypothetical protein
VSSEFLGLLHQIPIPVADVFDNPDPSARYSNVDNRLAQSLFIQYWEKNKQLVTAIAQYTKD